MDDRVTKLLEKVRRKLKKKGSEQAFEYLERLAEGLDMVNPRAAGIDVASGEHWVCVPKGCRDECVVRFGAYTKDLLAIRDLLLACKVETVAMESTGVYWIPLYDTLEQAGLQVYLVNARDLKAVKGRPKTDRLDSQWLQRLHSYGLLKGSYRPPSDIREMRDIWRMRDQLTKDAGRCVLRMQKALHTMNVLLTKVISDVTGQTGMAIIRAIAGGETDPVKLAKHRDRRVRASHEEFVEALRGQYRPEQVFLLRKALEQYDFLMGQIGDYDQEVERRSASITKSVTLDDAQRSSLEKASKESRGKYQKAPQFDVHTWAYRATGVDVTQIPGLNGTGVLGILLEVGTNLSAWRSVEAFCSWLGLCPNDKKSAGKNLGSGTKKCKNRAAGYFRMAASTLRKSRCPLGSFFRRMQLRHDTAHAITATAHKLAKLFYIMITRGEAYTPVDERAYNERVKAQQLLRLQKRARQLGFHLVSAEDKETAGSEAANASRGG